MQIKHDSGRCRTKYSSHSGEQLDSVPATEVKKQRQQLNKVNFCARSILCAHLYVRRMENRRFRTETPGHLLISSLLPEKEEILSKCKVKKEWWMKQKWDSCTERKIWRGKKPSKTTHYDAQLKLIFAVRCIRLLHFLMQIIVFFFKLKERWGTIHTMWHHHRVLVIILTVCKNSVSCDLSSFQSHPEEFFDGWKKWTNILGILIFPIKYYKMEHWSLKQQLHQLVSCSTNMFCGHCLSLHFLSRLLVLKVPLALHIVTSLFVQGILCELLLYGLLLLRYRMSPSER